MRFAKFAIVGGLGTLVNTGALIVFYHQLHFALVPASIIATELAIAHNFVWNNYWTFGVRGLSLLRFVQFNAVSVGGQGITVFTLWALVTFVSLHYVIANLVGIGLALIWNFTLNVHWTWRAK